MLHPTPRPCLRLTWVCLCCVALFNLTTANVFDCGKPLGPCGRDVPAGTTCPKGAGWCAAGHYCGYVKDETTQKCVPLPKNCGKVGNVCCPSNAKTPHTKEDGLNRRPFCTDGSTCVFSPLQQTTSMTPEFAGVEGDACVSLETCGTGPNSPCCPGAYRTAFNPDKDKSECPENFFCAFDDKKGQFPGSKLLGRPTGLCQHNAADCGKLGKPCCVADTGCCRVTQCEPGPGKKGFCAAADGSTKGVKDQDQICQLCPASGCP